jgi:hypothetical protein
MFHWFSQKKHEDHIHSDLIRHGTPLYAEAEHGVSMPGITIEFAPLGDQDIIDPNFEHGQLPLD